MAECEKKISGDYDPTRVFDDSGKEAFIRMNNKYKEEQRRKQERADDWDFFNQFNGGRWCNHDDREVIDGMWTCMDCGLVMERAGYKRDMAYCSLLMRNYKKSRPRKARAPRRKPEKPEKPEKREGPRNPLTMLNRAAVKYSISREGKERIRDDFVAVFGDPNLKQHTNVSVVCYQLLVKNGVPADKALFRFPSDSTIHGRHVRRTCYFALNRIGWEMAEM